MAADAVIGTKSNNKKVYVWLLTESGRLRWFILMVLALTFFFYWAIPAMSPPITQTATAHEIYLPPNYWLVDDVQNILTSEYGTKAIALMQIEARSIAEFREKTEKIYPRQYMTIGVWPGHSSNYVRLDYYAKSETSTEVVHVASSIASPTANRWGVYEAEGKMAIKDGKLIIPRIFHRYAGAIHVLVLLAAVISATLLIPNYFITLGLRKIYKNYLRP